MRIPTLGESAESASPSRVKLELAVKLSSSGSPNTPAAASTPGRAARLSVNACTNPPAAPLVLYFDSGRPIANVSTWSGENPGST